MFTKMGQMLSIDHQDGDGKTSLSRAIIKECSFRNERSPHYSKCSVHTDELLLEGANPNIPDNTGFTPLVYACNYGCLDVVNNLLSKGADPNETALRITFQSHLKFSGKILKRLLIDYKGKVDPIIIRELLLYGANANTLGLVNGDNLEIVEELKDYFPSLQILSTRSMRKHRVNITKIPPEIYPS